MHQNCHIYAVIIGSEILDRRRVDKHFDYLSLALEKKGFTLFASFVIKDDVTLIKQVFELVKSDSKAIMFSFGGIGSTPDDLTRQISSRVFSDGILYRNQLFEQAIVERLQERAYPYPIKMSDLPYNAGLLFNPINNMSGYYLDEKYFFMPGFPEMAQPMMDEIITNYLPDAQTIYTKRLLAQCGEGKLMHLMIDIPDEIELSSLPMINGGNPNVEFSLSAQNESLMQNYFKRVTDFLEQENIEYALI